MRTFRLRVWDKIEGNWLDQSKAINRFVPDKAEPHIYDFTNEDGKLEFTQFTGMVDAENQEVYEGDILVNLDLIPEERQYWPVTFEDGVFVVNDSAMWDYAAAAFGGKVTNQLDDLVVEGNIYQDRQLLSEWQLKHLKELGYAV